VNDKLFETKDRAPHNFVILALQKYKLIMTARVQYLLIFFSLLLIYSSSSQAAKVDTVSVYSQSMDKHIKVAVVQPETTKGNWPTLYLLHGYSGNHHAWLAADSPVPNLADQYGMLIVCPDGGYDSWYFDSPHKPKSKYETFISQELVKYIDQHYSTITKRSSRAITGLSMGGHGALYLAFRHPEQFGAAGSMSGGVDIRPFPNNWNIKSYLGNYADHPENWEQHTVINQTHRLAPGLLSLIIDCGTEDFFYEVNRALHEKLTYHNIPHSFISRPGKHNWPYWMDAVHYQVLFFHTFFEKGN
jgi:S-formylglutathione hydrolase FrmB